MTTRLGRKDWILLAAALPLLVFVFVAHVHETQRTELAQLPVFAKWNPGDYPQVGGYRLETDSSGSGLEIGDRLIRIADRDLRNVGYIGFQAIGLARTTPGHPVEIEIERDGARRVLPMEARPHPQPWARIPILILMPALSVLLLLRAPGQPDVRRFYAFSLAYAIGQAHFYGGPEWQTWLAQIIWSVASVLVIFLMIRWTRAFPTEMPEERRVPRSVAWLAAGLYLVFVRANYMLGWPLPIEWVPRVSFASHGVFALLGAGIFGWNYTQAYAAGRRRLRWILLGTTIGALPVLMIGVAPILAPEWSGFRAVFALGFLSSAIWMTGAVLGAIRDNAFDVDRLIGAATAGALATGGAAAVLALAVPALSTYLAETHAVDPSVTGVAFAAVIGALVVALTRRMRPYLEGLLLPEQIAQETDAVHLAESLRQCDTTTDLLDRALAGSGTLMDLDAYALYARTDGGFQLRSHHGEGWAPSLSSNDAPSEVVRASAVPEGLRPMARVVLPVVAGREHAALLCLGPKHSGDIFTNRDTRILSIVASACEREWLRLLKRESDLESEAKTNLLAEAGHDLRQPLHAVSLLTDALHGRLADPDLRSLVERIGTSTRDLDEMLTSLLDRSRLDTNSIRPIATDIALADVFEMLEREFEFQARETGNDLRFVPTRRIVRSDRTLLTRMLRNLVVNALRYAPGVGVIVGARKEGGRVRIEVRDAGPGIPQEKHDDVFAAFTQLRGGARSGLGLGLSIVDGLASLLDHEVRLRSMPGRGSTFAIVAQGGRAADARKTAPRPPLGSVPGGLAETRARRVLIVEDDERVRHATVTLLESWGYEVREASCEREALDVVRTSWQPEIVVADQHLRVGALGTEVVARLRRAVEGPLRAIIMMAETSPEQLERIKTLGDPVLRKPVRPAQLRSLMQSLSDDRTGAGASTG